MNNKLKTIWQTDLTEMTSVEFQPKFRLRELTGIFILAEIRKLSFGTSLSHKNLVNKAKQLASSSFTSQLNRKLFHLLNTTISASL
jgi:hypothetical protein